LPPLELLGGYNSQLAAERQAAVYQDARQAGYFRLAISEGRASANATRMRGMIINKTAARAAFQNKRERRMTRENLPHNRA